MTTPTGLNQTHCPILQSLCNKGQTITHIQSYTNQTTTHIQSYTDQTTTHMQFYTGQTTTHIQSYIGQLVPTRLHLWTCNAPEEEAQQLRWQPSIHDLMMIYTASNIFFLGGELSQVRLRFPCLPGWFPSHVPCGRTDHRHRSCLCLTPGKHIGFSQKVFICCS